MNKIDCYTIPDMDKCSVSPKKTIFQICEDIMIFIILYPIILNILGVFHKSNFVFVQGLFLITYTILLTLIRIKIKNHILAIILSLILCCTFLAIPLNICERILYGIYVVLMLINSIKKFFKTNSNFYNVLFFALSEALLLINLLCAYGLNNTPVKYLTLFSGILFSLTFLFYFNRSRYNLLINSEKNITHNNISKSDLKKFVIALFSVFLAFICFFLLITNRINSNSNYAFVHKVISVFGTDLPQTPKYENNTLPKKLNNLTHFNISKKMPKSKNTNKSSSTYVYVIIYLVLAALTFFIISKTIKFVLSLRIKNQSNTEIETVFLKDDFKKDLERIIPTFNFNLSNKEKLRRYYKKLIKRYRKKGLNIKDSLTPMELKDEILNLTDNNIEDITKIYDKARYSSYEPTKDDIAIVKKMQKDKTINKNKPL